MGTVARNLASLDQLHQLNVLPNKDNRRGRWDTFRHSKLIILPRGSAKGDGFSLPITVMGCCPSQVPVQTEPEAPVCHPLFAGASLIETFTVGAYYRMMDFTALDRARSRLSWSRRELERFEQSADEADPRTPHIRRKLQEDVDQAERNLRHAQGREGA
jgi:hypothetical protein